MVLNIKRVLVMMISAVFILGFSMASMVTAEVVDIKGGESEHGGESWQIESYDIENLDIRVDIANQKLDFGHSWMEVGSKEELKKLFGNEDIDLEKKSEKLFTINIVELEPDDPTHTCWYCWWSCAAGGCWLKCVPSGCEGVGH